MIHRRQLLVGATAMLFAPAVIRSGALMPISGLHLPWRVALKDALGADIASALVDDLSFLQPTKRTTFLSVLDDRPIVSVSARRGAVEKISVGATTGLPVISTGGNIILCW